VNAADAIRWRAIAGPMPEGTEVWAQVDAVDIETNYGGVLETHEYNGSRYNSIAHVEIGSASTLTSESLSRKTASSSEQPGIERGDLPPRLLR
jgi:hypothetical protein